MIDDHKKQSFKTDMGQNAIFERDDIKGSGSEMANARLRQIGKGMEQMVSPPNRPVEYVGSAAVHIYRSGDVFKVLDFAAQVATLNEVPEHVASTALDALRKNMQKHYRGDHQKLRSGF